MKNLIKNELTAFFDVDQTLIMAGYETHKDVITIMCPYTKEELKLVPHKHHIKILKDQKARGYHITVWSANGWQWVDSVLTALGLWEYVDEGRGKSIKFFDDLPADQVLGTRVYIDFKKEQI